MTDEHVFFYSDLHRRDTDVSSIRGYVAANEAVSLDLIDYVLHEKITRGICLGDLYDKGYRAHDYMWSHACLDRELTAALNGKHNMNIGNHFFIQRDTNPELYLIQPNSNYTTKNKILQRVPVIQVVDELVIGCVQISFFHYRKVDKTYINRRIPGIKYHVGVYHDESVLPSSARDKAGIPSRADSAYLRMIYDGIDLAIVGHVHTPIGVAHVNIDERTVPIIIPGSLSVLTSKPSDMHTSVNLPILDITDDNMSFRFDKFKLHTDMLKIYREKEELTKFMNTGNAEYLPTQANKDMNLKSYVTLESFLAKKNYSDADMLFIKRATNRELTIIKAMKLAHGRTD